jgi:hypothetical protein
MAGNVLEYISKYLTANFPFISLKETNIMHNINSLVFAIYIIVVCILAGIVTSKKKKYLII